MRWLKPLCAVTYAALLLAGIVVHRRWPACRFCGWRDWSRYESAWYCRSCGGRR